MTKNALDVRADTICNGTNWRLISTYGQCCGVYGFHDDFHSIKDVPIARVAIGICDENGCVTVLLVNQALLFGASMCHSLINPNQIRHHGIPVLDNPYDGDRDFGIDYDDMFVPFKTEGSTVYFDTFVPIDSKLNTCPRIILTDSDAEWNPQCVIMNSNRPYGYNVARISATNAGQKQIVPVEYESDLCLGFISSHLIREVSSQNRLQKGAYVSTHITYVSIG